VIARRRIGQAGIRGARVAGKYPAFSKGVPVECVVIAVYFIDDTGNLSKKYTEYDVKDLRTGQIYNNVRRVDSVAGMDDGEENVLRPAQKLIGAQSSSFDPKIDQLSQSDGDRVAVTFSYGAQHTPVITDVLPHPQLSYGTTKAQGQRRFQTHKGTSIETKSDGTYQIKRNDTTITLNADETIDIVHKSGSVMHFRDNGDIEATANANMVVDGQAVMLGTSTAAIHPAPEFDVYRASETTLHVALTALVTAIGAFGTATAGDPTMVIHPITVAAATALTAATVPAIAAIQAFEAAAATYLSKKVTNE